MIIEQLIEGAVKVNASDIHIMENSPPYFRIDGVLIPVKHPAIGRQDIKEIVKSLREEDLSPKLEKDRAIDLGYQYKDLIRCRVIVFYERQRYKIVLRLIPIEIPTIEALELPEVLKKIASYHRGMVVVTGPTGSGKSTTLAAMIDYINSNYKVSILTIEDPIEFSYTNKKAIINQREVGDDVLDYNIGLIQALRQDPDVILLGEMRDLATMRTAIKAAETGHLVFSTLHTTNAIQTIERIIANFPESEHGLVLEQLAGNLKAVITQNLVKRPEGKGRIAALEIMIGTDMISKLISDNRIADIYGVMKGGEESMQTFDQALANLVRANKITEEEGENYCRDVYAYRRFIKGVQSSSDSGGIISGFDG